MFKKKNEDDLYRASKNAFNKKNGSFFPHTNQKEEKNTYKRDITPEDLMNNDPSYSKNKVNDEKENKPSRSNTFIPYLDNGETKASSSTLAKMGKIAMIAITIIMAIIAIYTIVIIGVLFYSFAEGEKTIHYDESEVQSQITAQSYTNFTIFNVNGEKIMDIACQDYNESYANMFVNDKGITTTDIYVSDQQLNKLRTKILAKPTSPLIIQENDTDKQVRFLLQANVNGDSNDNIAIDTSLSNEVIQMIASETSWGVEMDSSIDLDSLGFKNNLYAFVSYENDEYLLIGAELK